MNGALRKFLAHHERMHALFGHPSTRDLPMTGKLTRESKKRNAIGLHKYVLTLKFTKSRHWYSDEIIHARDKRSALRIARRNWPNARIK